MKTTLTVEIEYDSQKTDPEGLACAMDRLLETALSTPGILDEYGNPAVGEFLVATGTATEAALNTARLELTQPADSDRTVGRTIRLPCYGITVTLARENGTKEPGSGSIVSDLRPPRRLRTGNTMRPSTASNR